MITSINLKKNTTQKRNINKQKPIPFVPQKEVKKIEERLRRLGYID